MWTKSPFLLEKIYPSAHWRIPVKDNSVYLTFDDGPHPTITPKVLDLLDKYRAKATFFCIGRNVEQFPKIFEDIVERGHQIGNHTFGHLNGWKTLNKDYFEDVGLAANFIESNLFRPPYGRITTSQLWKLKKDYKIIMWDVLSMDFSKNINPAHCLANVISNVRKGSVIVFHDSEKACENMLFALDKSLEYLSDAQFKMVKIDL